MKKVYIFLNVLFILFGCNNGKQNRKVEFKKGDKLSMFYNFDDIKTVQIDNYPKTKILNQTEIIQFVSDLKTYYFSQLNAPSKPGNLTGKITFKNNKNLWFYSNSSADFIFYYLDKDENLMTFKTDKKVNFLKY